MRLRDRTTIICILLGTVLLFFTGGHWSIPIMAYVFAIPLLIIIRNFAGRGGRAILLTIICVASFFKNPGLVMGGFPADQLVSMIVGIPIILPFIADLRIGRRLVNSDSIKMQFLGTLVFPSAFALLESLLSFQPTGYICSLAATQADIPPLLQLASVTGGSGITFVVAWVAPLILFVYKNLKTLSGPLTVRFRYISKYVCIALAVMIIAFAFGGIRLASYSDMGEKVRISLAAGPERHMENGEWRDVPYEKNISFMKKAVKQAVSDNSEMIVFCEEAFEATPNTVDKMKNDISTQAKKSGIIIVAGLDVYDEGGDSSNRVCMFSPDGNLVYDYAKSILIPLVETFDYKPGDGNMPVVGLSLGDSECCVSTAICFEGEYSHYMNTLTNSTDIHLNPSWEWDDACGFHTAILKVRAVEHGVNLVKPTYEGPSVATDSLGRTITSFNVEKCGYNTVVTADIPVQGINTIFNYIKYVIPWIYVIMLIVLVLLAAYFSNTSLSARKQVR